MKQERLEDKKGVMRDTKGMLLSRREQKLVAIRPLHPEGYCKLATQGIYVGG